MSSADSENPFSEEWKSCLSATDKFDKILVDLRKYGFTLLTGLTTGGSFLGFSDPAQTLQIGVIIVTMILVDILYWVDVYYQNLLYGAVMRTRFLEIFRLNRGLSYYISGMAGSTNLANTLPWLYGGFITGLFILGMIVLFNANCGEIISSNSVAANSTSTDQPDDAGKIASCFKEAISRTAATLLALLMGVYIPALAFVIFVHFLFEKKRMGKVKKIIDTFEKKRPEYLKETKPEEKEAIVAGLEDEMLKLLKETR